jgi:hypothetical protein
VASLILYRYVNAREVDVLYRVSQGERPEFWEVTVSVLFRTVSEIQLFHCTVPKLLIRKRYYVLFLISVFIVQVTKLVQFT